MSESKEKKFKLTLIQSFMLKTKTPRALGLVRSSLNSPKGIHGKHAANVLRGETSDVFSLQ